MECGIETEKIGKKSMDNLSPLYGVWGRDGEDREKICALFLFREMEKAREGKGVRKGVGMWET